ncbi:MAG: DDE-type integrase/transposase/recombinase [Sphingobacteriaceae bacterium]|nr:DDE-type integrase/transposase/recombinase [Sphingobacteriaceae bacterium]
MATNDGCLYLATVIDLYSNKVNKVIAYATSDKIDRWLVVKARSNALQARGYLGGVIMHTDLYSNYCSKVCRNLIKQNSLVGSMSRKGNSRDKAVAENFFGLIKKKR